MAKSVSYTKFNLIKKFIDKLNNWAHTRYSVWAMFLCAFLDSSILPLPTPMFFITLVLLNKENMIKYAISGTVGTLLGAFMGYGIGYFAWLKADGNYTDFALFVFDNVPGITIELHERIRLLYEQWGFGVLFAAAFIPVPYKIFSISSGIFDINIFLFGLATIISQWMKFYFLGLLTFKLGDKVKMLLTFKPKLVTSIIAVSVISIIIIVLIHK